MFFFQNFCPTLSSIGGRGGVINPVDKLCKQLYDCHGCISHKECDYEGRELDGRYSYKIDHATNRIDCDQTMDRKVNQGRVDCKQAMCECDRTFAEKLGNIWKDSEFDTTVWWNLKNIRKMKSAGKPLDKYSTICKKKSNLPNTHVCCGRILFNPVMKDCCSDKIVGIGNC